MFLCNYRVVLCLWRHPAGLRAQLEGPPRWVHYALTLADGALNIRLGAPWRQPSDRETGCSCDALSFPGSCPRWLPTFFGTVGWAREGFWDVHSLQSLDVCDVVS